MKKSLYDYCMENGQEDLLCQWHPTKNAPQTPEKISYGSHKEAWWRCDYGHEWQTSPNRRTVGRGCPYCSGKTACAGESDLASQRPELAAQWHPTKNKELTPTQVTLGSQRKVWWCCDKGHEWQATVANRTNGRGCPVCANRSLLSGENDLATVHPLLAKEWHPEKNGSLTPSNILAGSQRKVWWRCDKGHEWAATINARIYNSGCPICAGKVVIPGENDLATAYPDVAKEWHPTKNHLTPQEVTPYSNRNAWWQCPTGHEYSSRIDRRTNGGTGCPYCAGKKVLVGFNDLATLEPRIAAQWHPTLNEPLTPDMVTVGSQKKVWWQCQDGHVWKTVVSDRRKHGCPFCTGKFSMKRQDR